MKLLEVLSNYTLDKLRPLAGMCYCSNASRRDDFVHCINHALTSPAVLKKLWQQLDGLSQKAVTSAYHYGGEFKPVAFKAQYGLLPERAKRDKYSFWYEFILLDLFLFHPTQTNPYYAYSDTLMWQGLSIPDEMMPLLTGLVSPPDRFQVGGLDDAPTSVNIAKQGQIELMMAETEQPGWHDLMAYLRLVDQEQIRVSKSSGRITGASSKTVLDNLLVDDYFSLPDNFRVNDTIRPYGLDVFVQGAELARNRSDKLSLTKMGQAFYQSGEPEILLEAFEIWTEKATFDELSRISKIKGQNTRKTRLTHAAERRSRVVEALSWCPAGVWIDLHDFFRAIKIWEFDFDVEKTAETNLKSEVGWIYEPDAYWALVKGSYIKVLLWETLATIGVLDLLYVSPENSFTVYSNFMGSVNDYSPYDGLKYFRINNLGAYLLGQAGTYETYRPSAESLFTISTDFVVNIIDPQAVTPNVVGHLERLAIPQEHGAYQLDTQQLLSALEAGADLAFLSEFLQARHKGPLPQPVVDWLNKVEQNSQMVKLDSQALLIKVKTEALAEALASDAALRRYCTRINGRTLVIPANREKAFRRRLKELEYILTS